MSQAPEDYTYTVTAVNCRLDPITPASLQRALQVISASCDLPLLKFGQIPSDSRIQHVYVSLEGADLLMNFYLGRRLAVLTLTSNRPIKVSAFRAAIRQQLQPTALKK